jgi:hypothetical protein
MIMTKPIHEMSEGEYREFHKSSTPDEWAAAHKADEKRRRAAAKRAGAARLRNAPKLNEMTAREKDAFYRTAGKDELVDAANAEDKRIKGEAKKSAPARKTAPRRVVVNRASAGQNVPIQAGRVENSTTVTGGTVRTSGTSSSSKGAKKAAAPRGGSRTTFHNSPGSVVGMQAGNINGATVVVSSNIAATPAPPRPRPAADPAPAAAPAPAAKKTTAKKVVKKAPAKQTAAEVPSTPPKPDVAAAVAQVQADQAKRLAAEEKARKAAARAATRPGLPEQGPEVTGLPLPGQLPKTQAAKKVVKKAPARPPMTFAARHRKVRRVIRLIRRKPHHAAGLALVFLATGAVHVAIRTTRFGGRRAWSGLRAMGRGYDQYRRMAKAAKLEHRHAGCPKCGGTGVIPLRAADGSYAGSRPCRR